MPKKPLFISIRTKFWVLVAVLIITTLTINTFEVFQHNRKIIREELESKARSIAASLSLEGTEAMADNLYLIQNSLSKFTQLPGVSQILFIDDSNMVTAANDTSKIGDMLSEDALFVNAVQRQAETLSYFKNKNGEELLVIFEPMYLKDKIHAWIRLDLSLADTEKKIRKSFLQLLLVAMILTGLAIFSTFAISQQIGVVLKNLVSKFKKLAEGDFTQKLDVRSNDELGEVALSYNILVDQMRSMVQQLKQKHQKAEAELRDSEEFFRALYENAQHPVYVFGEDLRFVDANPYACDFFGYSLDELKQMSLLDLSAPGERPAQEEIYEIMLREGGLFIKELRQQKRTGEIVTMTSDNVEVFRSGKTYYVSKATDISERKEAEERLSHLANYDVLTNLPNRILFIDRLTQALSQAKRNQKLVAVLFLDLDRFKIINDTLGHTVGDQLLKAISKTLIAGRETDTVTRLGGDEFTIMLTNITHAKDAALVAEKILNTLALNPYRVTGHEIFITASIGITIYPYDGEDIESLLKNADTAMYRAKDGGRNNYQFYTSDMNNSALERLELETSLRRAVEKKEFLLYYQPIIELNSGAIIGAEALIRWQHPSRGLLTPKTFITLAEETGLILPIGECVLETACRQNQAWMEAGLGPLRISVNISVFQFQEQHFVENIKRILKESRLDPHLLELEVTESNLMQNLEKTKITLHQLNQLGVKLSIDDFGTGYSSLSYLKRFPIDTLKIDHSFIKDVSGDKDDQAITSAIIAMARYLGLKVIAEGVETESQLKFLLSKQCDSIQGYLFSEPLPARAFESLLTSRKVMDLGRYKDR